ncbi:MAG: MurR/RpiR family transcriptional regulator [Erysipelotrichaceae bacterium]|nr:MurR/RpiR family transcriptional regulator [Erysipelotrichaceae bacterium]
MNMNILLSRILTYLNGTLSHDAYYDLCTFMVFHYLEIQNMDEETFLKEVHCSKDDFYAFINMLDFDTYDDFMKELVRLHHVRLDQIKDRMNGIDINELVDSMEKVYSNEEMLSFIDIICEKLYQAKRIVIYGALYPVSIAVELQTDMISFGKPFIQFHSYDPVPMNENDVAIIISATGRYVNSFQKTHADVHIERAHQVLITQNKKYLKTGSNEKETIIYVPGKFDSINFNYQIMTICDLIRIDYYAKYVNKQ